jgi:N-acetylmuramoyl-L-alanine amidase
VDLANRGVRQAAFYVLRGANAPAVLVEMGFLSNAKDEAKLESEKYRRKIVEGIYAGVVEYSRRRGWSTEEAR